MGAGCCEPLGEEITDTTRGAGNQSNTPGEIEGFSHGKRTILLERRMPGAGPEERLAPPKRLCVVPAGCEERRMAQVVGPILVCQARRVILGEAGIAILRCRAIAGSFPERAVEALNREEAQRICADEVGH